MVRGVPERQRDRVVGDRGASSGGVEEGELVDLPVLGGEGLVEAVGQDRVDEVGLLFAGEALGECFLGAQREKKVKDRKKERKDERR